MEACAAKHEVSVAELMAGSCQRKVVACRDEVNYRLHAMKPQATIETLALAVKKVMEREHLTGTLKLWPGIAEELLGAKAFYVRAGQTQLRARV